MARGSSRQLVDNFHGGVNYRDSGFDVSTPDLVDARDVVPDGEAGALVNRAGDTTLVDIGALSPGPIKRMWWSRTLRKLILQASTNQLIACNSDGSGAAVFYTPGADTGAIYMLFEGPVSGGQGPIYFFSTTTTGAVSALRQWTGAGLAAAWTFTTAPSGTGYVALIAGNRVWNFARAPSWQPPTVSDSRVWWSELGDPRTFPAANTLQLDPGTSTSQIVGGGTFGSYVFVFKRAKAWIIYDLDTGANRPLGEDVGALNAETIVNTPVGLVFIDPSRGPMVTDGSSVKELPHGTKIGRNVWLDFVAASYRDEHIYFVTSAGDTYDYFVKGESWWPYDVQLEALTTDGDVIYSQRVGSTNIDRIAQSGSASAGVPLTPRITTPHLKLGDPSIRKRIRSIEVFSEVDGLQLTPQLDVELAGTPIILPAADVGGGRRVPGVGVANMVALTIEGSGAFQLDAVSVDYLQRAR